MRIGVIGCGAVAYHCHVPALKRIPGVTITAAADPDEAPRARMGKLTRAATYKSAEYLLARDDVDAVVIATPSHLHATVAIMAAKAGKSFYLEKPIATTAVEAHDVARAVADAGIVAAVGFNRRMHPLYLRARALIADGAIGAVRAVQSVFCEPVPRDGMPRWKRARATGGGVLLDLASHHVDLVRWMLGAEIDVVTASLRSELSEHDSAFVQMVLSSAARVQGFYSYRAGYADHMELIGEEATLRIDRHRSSLSIRTARRFGYGARSRFVAPSARDIGWRMRRLLHPGEDPSYHRALRAFAEEIRGRPSTLASLRDGGRSLAVILAAEESDRTGSPVNVPGD